MEKIENSYHVLLIDDDPAFASLIVKELVKNGFTASYQSSAAGAIQYLKNNNPSIILCDINMPRMSGLELRSLLLEEPATVDIPFIFLTGAAEPETQITGFRMDIDDYILKPFEPEVICARINSVLRKYEKFALKTRYDQLTGLLNRQQIETGIRRELSGIARKGGSLSIIFIDIDSFKQINDSFGHQTGDLVLKHFAGFALSELRDIDLAGRYAGDEFLLCLVNTELEQAAGVVERLLSRFSKTPIGREKIFCTFSAGIVTAPEDGTDFTLLCKKADEVMYYSKKKGRNRISSFRQIKGW
ncbi:MAG: diguanylate cyclase [Deltaproteobacteria bacterium]|nr:diguanylate cyclase [Deltaproteobacteria bacterium]